MWFARPGIPNLISYYGPSLQGLRWTPVEGGFSGAEVWRGDDPAGTARFAAKRWPVGTSEERLRQIHAWMRLPASLPFIPGLLPALSGATHVEMDQRLWDVTRWVPGQPLQSLPSASEDEVRPACRAVAHVHAFWLPLTREIPCPGLLRRAAVLEDWRSNPMQLTPPQDCPSEWTLLIERARKVIAEHLQPLLKALRGWEGLSVRVRPCFRDLRGEHILFTDEKVTGIVDFGAVDLDHPAVDLARLLGDLAGEDERLFRAGLDAYREGGGRLDVRDEYVRLLDRSGILCSIAGWLRRKELWPELNMNAKSGPRLRKLVGRAERFSTT
jgi:homoserine kinase type II